MVRLFLTWGARIKAWNLARSQRRELLAALRRAEWVSQAILTAGTVAARNAKESGQSGETKPGPLMPGEMEPPPSLPPCLLFRLFPRLRVFLVNCRRRLMLRGLSLGVRIWCARSSRRSCRQWSARG